MKSKESAACTLSVQLRVQLYSLLCMHGNDKSRSSTFTPKTHWNDLQFGTKQFSIASFIVYLPLTSTILVFSSCKWRENTQTFSVDYKAQVIIIESRIDFSSFSYLSGCWSFIIRKPDAQHADENDNWLRILFNLTVCEDARSFERTDHRTDSDGDASTDFKIFAASLFRESTRRRRSRDPRIAMIDWQLPHFPRAISF